MDHTGVWSREYPFDRASIQENVPDGPGVYEILQSEAYPRYQGETRVLKIGMTKASLRDELLNHLTRHTSANRLTRIRRRPGIHVMFRCLCIDQEEARAVEGQLLQKFEESHWEVPALNSTRGYARGTDKHYRTSAGM